MGKFITDQILGMKWLNALMGNLLNALGLDTTSRIGGSVQFFRIVALQKTLAMKEPLLHCTKLHYIIKFRLICHLASS